MTTPAITAPATTAAATAPAAAYTQGERVGTPAALRVSRFCGAWTRFGGGGVRTFLATARARVPIGRTHRAGRKCATCVFFRRRFYLTSRRSPSYAPRAKADEPSGSPALAFLVDPAILQARSRSATSGRQPMGLLDKLLGRGKKAATDMMGNASMRHEGAAQEREAAAEDRATQHEEMAQEQPQQAAEAPVERENT